MTYGIQMFKAGGVKTFDSTLAQAGLLVDVVQQPGSGSTLVKTYPLYPGRGCMLMNLSGAIYNYATSPTVDYALGYPRVTLPVDVWASYIMVWIT